MSISNDNVNTIVPLIDSILSIMNSDELQKNYSLEITPQVKTILISLTNNKEYFSNIQNTLKEIVKDDKIDTQDIPNIILLISELYPLVLQLNIKNITSEMCGNILKFIIHILINDDIVKVQDKPKLILTIDNIINSCVVLVNLEKSLTKNIPSFFSRFFCWFFTSNKN